MAQLSPLLTRSAIPMSLDAADLQKVLCRQLCGDIKVHRRPDGELMLDTQFRFPDGDSFAIHLAESGPGGLRLSDAGDTLMRISFEHDVDSCFAGSKGKLLERIINESGVEWEGGALTVRTAPEQLPEAIFRLGQAMTRVYDLPLATRNSQPAGASTFYAELSEMLFRCVDPQTVQRDHATDVPDAELYLVDYRIDGRNAAPLFVFGVPHRDKARLTAVILSHFHRHSLRFASLAVFRDESKIPLTDRTRLSDAGCESIPSLASEAEFQGKLESLLEPNGRTYQATIGD